MVWRGPEAAESSTCCFAVPSCLCLTSLSPSEASGSLDHLYTTLPFSSTYTSGQRSAGIAYSPPSWAKPDITQGRRGKPTNGGKGVSQLGFAVSVWLLHSLALLAHSSAVPTFPRATISCTQPGRYVGYPGASFPKREGEKERLEAG